MKYKKETFSMKEKEYIPKKKVERESIFRKEKDFHRIETLEKCVLKSPQKVFDRTQTFELEMFQLLDYEFVQWANQQKASMVIAIMSEMKDCPKMKPSIEMLRLKVSSIPLCSIELYRKKKRLGERSVSFLKQMKKRYGNSVLRILYCTYDS